MLSVKPSRACSAARLSYLPCCVARMLCCMWLAMQSRVRPFFHLPCRLLRVPPIQRGADADRGAIPARHLRHVRGHRLQYDRLRMVGGQVLLVRPAACFAISGSTRFTALLFCHTLWAAVAVSFSLVAAEHTVQHVHLKNSNEEQNPRQQDTALTYRTPLPCRTCLFFNECIQPVQSCSRE